MEFTAQRINTDLFLIYLINTKLQCLKSNVALRIGANGLSTRINYCNISPGVNLKRSSYFMLSPALFISSTKGFLGDVYTVVSSVTAAHRSRFNTIGFGAASDETAVSGAVRACRATCPCCVVPWPRQPNKSTSGMSPWAAISFPECSACR